MIKKLPSVILKDVSNLKIKNYFKFHIDFENNFHFTISSYFFEYIAELHFQRMVVFIILTFSL